MPKTITDWVQSCHRAAREKGFWEKERNVGEMLKRFGCHFNLKSAEPSFLVLERSF